MALGAVSSRDHFVLLSLSGSAHYQCHTSYLKWNSAGIGLFIAFVGLQNAGIVVADQAVVAIGSLREPAVILVW